MSSPREYEAANVTPPLKNTALMKCILAVPFSPVNQVISLTDYFGNYGDSHFYTVQADGGKCYLAWGGASGLIDPVATGVASGVCWALADGANINFIPVGGRDAPVGTGAATGTAYNLLHYRSPSGGATGFLRMFRSSLGQGQDASMFKIP